VTSYQRSLFDRGAEPAFDSNFGRQRRIELAQDAWVDHLPGWVSGQEQLFETLLADAEWQETEQHLYEQTVVTPRLVASIPERSSALPLLEAMRVSLSERYGEQFTRLSLALYRDGRDSVAFHGDRVARELPGALVATVSLGGARRFQLRPRVAATDGQPRRSVSLPLSGGDLVVMGGTCQRTWQHAIPKVKHASARIALMFRPVWQARA
jgi:alkylated DNA repair dioxygenase AlkB